MEENYYYEKEAIYEDVGEETSAGPTFLTQAGQWILVAFLLIFPFFVLPATVLPVEMNKGYFASIAALVILICWLGGALQEGRIRIVKTWAMLAYFIFLIVLLISVFFSRSFFVSLLGSGAESTTFLPFLMGGLFLLLIPVLLRDQVWVTRGVAALLLSFVALGLFFIVQNVLNIRLFSFNVSQTRFFNPIGSWNVLAGFFAFSAAVLLPFLGIQKSKLRAIAAGLFLAAVALVFLMNFTKSIIALGLISLVFVAWLLSRRMGHTPFFGIALGILLILTLMILLSDPIQRGVANPLGAPAEISPDWRASLGVIKESLTTSPLLGSGPGTFGLLWEEHRPIALNKSPFWALRFDNGASLVATLLAESGILGGLAFLAFLVFLVALAFRGLGGELENEVGGTLLRGLVAGTLLLFILWFLHSLNISLIILSFISAGLVVAAMRNAGHVEEFELDLFSSTERGFIGSLIIIFLLIASVAGIYYQAVRYTGQVVFARGIDEFNSGKGVNAARESLRSAIRYDSRQDRYQRNLSQFELVNLRRAINATNVPPEELQERFRTSLSLAIENARRATELNPNDPVNWIALGQVYETVVPFVGDASGFALEAYERAKSLAPNNPLIYLSLARTHLANAQAILLTRNGGKVTEEVSKERRQAEELLKKSTELKADFAEGHFLLAQIYAQEGRLNEAISRAEAAYSLASQDIGVLFQLGLLYNQKNDFKRARSAFEGALAINPNYSNALYFLGLIQDREGEKEKAVETFEKVAELNPENEEIKKIVENVRQGRSALEGIAPPPEERSEPPVSEPPQ